MLSFAGALAFLWQAQAQVIITSTTPANGATGVSPSTTVVFTFNTAMHPATMATFLYDSTNAVTTSPVWSGGSKTLTCTPGSGFPANKTIYWYVVGQSLVGQPISTFGIFTTGTGAGSGGAGTNAITSFTLGKLHTYRQTSPSLPTLDTNAPYAFSAITALSSNRTATNVLLTLPTAGVSNLTQNFFQPEMFTLATFKTNLAAFDTTFPSGDYVFNVQSVQSNQTVTVNFPSTLAQPGTPHVANYAAAQAVDATQPFTLTWDTFAGGTAADAIYVEIGAAFSSTNIGQPGALTGVATSLTIPAYALQPGTSYDSWLSFYRYVRTTNGTSYVTAVYRTTFTSFTLTTGGAAAALGLTNAVLAPANFSFDVLCAPGQTVTVQYRTNLAAGQWQTLLTTNSPGNRFRAVAPQAATNRVLFFRAKNGTE